MENVKKRKKPNAVDVAVILIVLAVVGFFGWRFVNRQVTAANMQTVTFEVRVDALPLEIYDDITSYPLPATLTSADKPVTGQVTASSASFCDVTEIEKKSPMTDYGTMIFTPTGEYVNATFTIEATVDSEDPLTTSGSQEIRTGRNYIVKTEFYEIGGTIVSVNRPWITE